MEQQYFLPLDAHEANNLSGALTFTAEVLRTCEVADFPGISVAKLDKIARRYDDATHGKITDSTAFWHTAEELEVIEFGLSVGLVMVRDADFVPALIKTMIITIGAEVGQRIYELHPDGEDMLRRGEKNMLRLARIMKELSTPFQTETGKHLA